MYQQLTWWRKNRADLQDDLLPVTCTKPALPSQVPVWPCHSRTWRSLTNGNPSFFFFFWMLSQNFLREMLSTLLGKQVNRSTSKVKQTCRKYCTWLLRCEMWDQGQTKNPVMLRDWNHLVLLLNQRRNVGKLVQVPAPLGPLCSPGQTSPLLCAMAVHRLVESEPHFQPLFTWGCNYTVDSRY